MGSHQTVLNDSFPMNTTMTGFRCFSKISCPLDESRNFSLSDKASLMNYLFKRKAGSPGWVQAESLIKNHGYTILLEESY